MAKVKVMNRAWGTTVYTIPEYHGIKDLTKIFGAGEVKEIDEEELEALSFAPGGNELLANYLQIMDPEVSEKLVYNKEPEYDMTEEDVKNLLLNGSYDAFLDCLDFAPRGVLDLVKGLAVKLPLNDNAKREAIKAKLHFDVGEAIAIAAEEKEDAPAETKTRRVQVEEKPERRVQTSSKYNVVNK